MQSAFVSGSRFQRFMQMIFYQHSFMTLTCHQRGTMKFNTDTHHPTRSPGCREGGKGRECISRSVCSHSAALRPWQSSSSQRYQPSPVHLPGYPRAPGRVLTSSPSSLYQQATSSISTGKGFGDLLTLKQKSVKEHKFGAMKVQKKEGKDYLQEKKQKRLF